MKIYLPDAEGRASAYRLKADPVPPEAIKTPPSRTVLAAAHVVALPFTDSDPSGPAAVDWSATMAFRRHLADLGFGIAEAMDTAQRGAGLDWQAALELIRRTRSELPDAIVFNGAGSDQLEPAASWTLDQIVGAYREQIDGIQAVGGRLVLMASRALAKAAADPEDYLLVYDRLLSACDRPVILHWLGDMFDPALAGYWGSQDIDAAAETFLGVIGLDPSKVDGVKLSLLNKEKEITLRRRLPPSVRMYTGDDFNYPELIEGDEVGHSDALLGIFDPVAPAAAAAVNRLTDNDTDGFRCLMDPTVPLSRHIFRSPTQHYKTGVVFLAWLNGFQDHFVMVGGAQAMRSLPYFVDCFKLADGAGLLSDPDLACARMRKLLAIYGF